MQSPLPSFSQVPTSSGDTLSPVTAFIDKPIMKPYLESSPYIDWETPEVLTMARRLAQGLDSPEAVARSCYVFVRDEIRHSLDHKLNPVTCRASEVLQYRTGYCYAKSHLLAALLRANRIPAGLCYQRLSIEGGAPPFCLHGLNAVYLEPYGWYRIDPRGDKPGVHAEFCPPMEKLAFPIQIDGEADLPEIWVAPLEIIIHTLTSANSYQQVAEKLPDLLLWHHKI